MSIEIVDKPFVKPEEITLNNGEKVVLPRMTLGKILAVTDGVAKLVETAKDKAPELFSVITSSAQSDEDAVNIGASIVKTLPSLLPIIMHELTSVLAAYLDKDQKWILDNMDMEDLVAVSTPFFGSILKQGNHLLGPLNQMLGKIKTSA